VSHFSADRSFSDWWRVCVKKSSSAIAREKIAGTDTGDDRGWGGVVRRVMGTMMLKM